LTADRADGGALRPADPPGDPMRALRHIPDRSHDQVLVPPCLKAEHLAYAYAGGKLAVRDVSISVRPGSLTAVIGANGSGKTTLIRILAGLLRPQAGRILLGNVAFDAWDPRLRAREIAYVPQTT